jgi:hypothetical protein
LAGHTSSRDEETAFYAAVSLLEGRLTRVSDQLRVVQVSYGVGGEPYSRYGLGISAMAAPLVKLGQLAAGLYPEEFRYFVERTVALATNALVTAGTAAVLCGMAQILGYGPGVGFLLGFTYAFGTFAFPQGRTLFSEPGAGLLLLVSLTLMITWSYRRPRGLHLLLLSGLMAGLAVVVKVHAALALPWLALYVVLASARMRLSPLSTVGRLTLWALGGLPALAVFVGYNMAAFGGPLRTGYSGETGRIVPAVFSPDIYEGLWGLTASPGKGLWLYAPPVLLAVGTLVSFRRKHPDVTLVSVGTWATALGFFATVEFWHGDAAWGPRYMLLVLPFMLLPAVAALGSSLRWVKVASRILISVGMLVQLLGTLVPFASYINTETNQQARYYQPLSTPVVGHARILAARWIEWYEWLFMRHRAVVVGNGFLNTAAPQVGALPRPMAAEGELDINGLSPGMVEVALIFRSLAGLAQGNSLPLAIWVDGQPVVGQYRWLEGGLLEQRFRFAASKSHVKVRLEASGIPSNRRSTAVIELSQAIVRDGSGSLSVVRRIYIPPWPPNLYGRWNWFFDPTIHHPLDSWLWYGVAMGAFKGGGLILPALSLLVSAVALGVGVALVAQRRHNGSVV